MQEPVAFGKYQLLSRLGAGGMAEAWKARMSGAAGSSKLVVIKRVLKHHSKDQRFITSFIEEGRVSLSLSHGNIAQVFDFGEVAGEYYLAIEYVQGCSLRQLLTRADAKGFRCLPTPVGCFLAIEVLKGLQYAHTRKGENGRPLQIVHRDVSPDNVMIGFEGQVKLVDFGIAKAAMAGREETAPGMVKGKFHYLSPEQVRAEPLDARSDVFAAGIVVYEMLCGRRPFEAAGHLAMFEIAEGRYPSPASQNPALPIELGPILARALEPVRDRRYGSALEMQEAIARFHNLKAPTFSAETLAGFARWASTGEDPAASLGGIDAAEIAGWLAAQKPAQGPPREAPAAATATLEDAPQTKRQKSSRLAEASSPAPRRTALFVAGGALALAIAVAVGWVVLGGKPGSTDGLDGAQLYALATRDLAAQDLIAGRTKLERCMDLDEPYAECARSLGVLYGRAGDKPKAAQWYRVFLRLAPHTRDRSQVEQLIRYLEGPEP